MASSSTDFLALVFGGRSRREASIEMEITGWIVVEIKDVYDETNQSFNKEKMKKYSKCRTGEWLGFMQIRFLIYSLLRLSCSFALMNDCAGKKWKWAMEPDYPDQLLMEAMRLQSARYPKVCSRCKEK